MILTRRLHYNNGVIVEVRIMGNSIEAASLVNHHSVGIQDTVLDTIMADIAPITDAAFQAPSKHGGAGRYYRR